MSFDSRYFPITFITPLGFIKKLCPPHSDNPIVRNFQPIYRIVATKYGERPLIHKISGAKRAASYAALFVPRAEAQTSKNVKYILHYIELFTFPGKGVLS